MQEKPDLAVIAGPIHVARGRARPVVGDDEIRVILAQVRGIKKMARWYGGQRNRLVDRVILRRPLDPVEKRPPGVVRLLLVDAPDELAAWLAPIPDDVRFGKRASEAIDLKLRDARSALARLGSKVECDAPAEGSTVVL